MTSELMAALGDGVTATSLSGQMTAEPRMFVATIQSAAAMRDAVSICRGGSAKALGGNRRSRRGATRPAVPARRRATSSISADGIRISPSRRRARDCRDRSRPRKTHSREAPKREPEIARWAASSMCQLRCRVEGGSPPRPRRWHDGTEYRVPPRRIEADNRVEEL